jgi:hypothetical protein
MAQRTEAGVIVSQVTAPAEHPFVPSAGCDAVEIEAFQQRHHDAPRTSQRLAQLAHS